MALDNIRANKGRSFLTMLGIIIGITSVVTIVSIGNGLKNDVVNATNLQTNTVTVQVNTEEVTDTQVITGEDIAFLGDTFRQFRRKHYRISDDDRQMYDAKRNIRRFCDSMTTPDYENAPVLIFSCKRKLLYRERYGQRQAGLRHR